MKKLLTGIFAIAFLAFSVTVNAQDEKAAPSPFSKVEQKVGTTDVTIEYSRPGVKGRTIIGDLVPYDKQWRTGANSVTKITFSKDVEVEGQAVAAGSYALMTTPGKEKWGVHFYEYTKGSGGAYSDAKPKVSVTVEAGSLGDSKVESFLIYIDELRDNSGTLMLVWDNVFVPVAMTVK